MDLREVEELEQEFVLRVRAYSAGITWFGRNSIGRAIGKAMARLVYTSHVLYARLLKRYSLLAGEGDDLTQTAQEAGAERDVDGVRSLVLGVPLPLTSTVLSIVGTLVEVPLGEGADWTPGWAVQLRNGDGSVSEERTVGAITTGTGPNGGDQIDLAFVTGSYTPATEDVALIARITIPAGTVIDTVEGVSFQTKEQVVSGEQNSILAGARPALSLATKVWCEAIVPGEVGNIEADTMTDSNPAIPGITGWYNPGPGEQGADTEIDGDLRYRAAHGPTARNQETLAWLEALAAQVDPQAIRAFKVDALIVGEMRAKLLKANGGTFSAAELLILEAYMNERVRSYMTVDLDNVTRTAVEVEAVVDLDPDFTLREAWISASNDLADYLDWRRWEGGINVDEAALLSIVRNADGIVGLETSTFLPAADVVVAEDSIPHLTRVSLRDRATGDTINATLAQSF